MTEEQQYKGKVEIWKDKSKNWRWTKVANNGEIIADSAEGYAHKQHVRKMAEAEAGEDYEVVERGVE